MPTKTGLRTLICFHSDIFSSDKTAEQWKNARGNRDTPSFRQRFWRKGDRKKFHFPHGISPKYQAAKIRSAKNMSSQYVARRYFIRSAMLVRNFVTNYLATGRNYVRIVPDDVCGIVVIYHHVAATRQHSASNKISSSMNLFVAPIPFVPQTRPHTKNPPLSFRERRILQINIRDNINTI